MSCIELGIRHSVRKPVVHICDEQTKLPFDIAPERTLKYINDMLGIQEFKPKLIEFISAAMKELEPSNPVYDAIQTNNIMENIGSADPLKYLIKSVEGINQSLSEYDINRFKQNNQDNLNMRLTETRKTFTVQIDNDGTDVSELDTYIRNEFINKYGFIPQVKILITSKGTMQIKIRVPDNINIDSDEIFDLIGSNKIISVKRERILK